MDRQARRRHPVPHPLVHLILHPDVQLIHLHTTTSPKETTPHQPTTQTNKPQPQPLQHMQIPQRQSLHSQPDNPTFLLLPNQGQAEHLRLQGRQRQIRELLLLPQLHHPRVPPPGGYGSGHYHREDHSTR